MTNQNPVSNLPPKNITLENSKNETENQNLIDFKNFTKNFNSLFGNTIPKCDQDL